MTRILPLSLGRKPTLSTCWFWTSWLQNCKRIHCYHFKPPRWWWFVIAALGNWDNIPFSACRTLMQRPLRGHLRSDYYSLGACLFCPVYFSWCRHISSVRVSIFHLFFALFSQQQIFFPTQMLFWAQGNSQLNRSSLKPWGVPGALQIPNVTRSIKALFFFFKHLVRHWESLPSLQVPHFYYHHWVPEEVICMLSTLNFSYLDLLSRSHPNFPFFEKVSWEEDHDLKLFLSYVFHLHYQHFFPGQWFLAFRKHQKIASAQEEVGDLSSILRISLSLWIKEVAMVLRSRSILISTWKPNTTQRANISPDCPSSLTDPCCVILKL